MDATLDRIEKRGFDKGYDSGFGNGFDSGFDRGISVLIKVQKRQGTSYQDTEKILQEEYDLDEERSQQYMQKYWK